MSELQAAQQIALSRRQRIVRGVKTYGMGAVKMLMPHGLYKLGKKGKRAYKRLKKSYSSARETWRNNAMMNGGGVALPQGGYGVAI